jgi:hypothetical protein
VDFGAFFSFPVYKVFFDSVFLCVPYIKFLLSLYLTQRDDKLKKIKLHGVTFQKTIGLIERLLSITTLLIIITFVESQI